MTTASMHQSRLVTPAGLTRASAFTALLVALPLVFNAHWMVNLLFFTVLYAAMSVAWNLIGGYAGYPSLGHAAFFGLGAYGVSLVFTGSQVLSNGYEPFLLLPLVGLGAGLIALPIGLIAMRTRADVFAIVTITLLFVAQTLAFNLKGLTGGAQGASVAPPPFRLEIFEQPFYFAAAALLLLAMGLTYLAVRTKIGLALTAIRADEDKARGIGIRTTAVKLMAFSVSVGLVAMAGGIWAYYVGFVYPQFAVDPLLTIAIVLMTFLGGRATLWGPVLGAAILMPAQQLLAYYVGGSRLYLIAYAAIFLLIILLLPRGVLPTVFHRRRLSALAATASQAEAQAVPSTGPEVLRPPTVMASEPSYVQTSAGERR
ncbi:MAG: amino acid/amide transporter rane protein 2, family [Frankiales bacterium]|nr:amino acid/amide transporter rane protein 2, family [Frankiales bacterium]